MKWFYSEYLGEGNTSEQGFAFKRWDVPGEWLPMHYFEAMNCLFRIENALRLLVFIVLKSHFGEKWTGVALSTEDAQSTSIGAIARKRVANDQKFAYLNEPLTCPLMYLTAGELVGLILSDSYWKLFKRYFPGASSVMQVKLQEIACIRNALAHFRPVTPEQVSILRKNGTQILKKFQLEFDELVFEKASATKFRSWRLSLPVHGSSKPISIRCSQKISKSGQWVFLKIVSDAQVLKNDTGEETCHIRLKSLDMDKLLRAFPNVRHKCVIARERASAPAWDGDSELPPITKVMHLVFPNISPGKQEHVSKLALLPPELRSSPALDLAEPIDLFSTHIVTATEFKHDQRPSWWNIHAFEMIERVNPSEFHENWTSLSGIGDDDESLSTIAKYPWMNALTSEDF